MRNPSQMLIGVGVLAIGGMICAGATGISSEAGYSGVGPDFLPWLVGGFLLLCGGFLLYEAQSGGFRQMEAPEGAEQGDWAGFAWVSTGILANAALITIVGFILSCAVCFVLAARGFKAAQRQPDLGLRAWLTDTVKDAAIGIAIAAPVYWMFTKLLSINLPGLTGTGWL